MKTRRLALPLALLLADIIGSAATAKADVETILEAVERAGDRVQDIRCDVHFVVTDEILESVKKRTGSILFRKSQPNPRFLITFEKSVTDGVVSREKLWYLFDGRYLFEASERSRSIIKRDIAPPGQDFDFFSLDKAPIPIPFGQKKAEILKHFNVTTVAPKPDDPPHTDHLICVPKPESRFTTEYQRLEFYVSRSLQLPIRIRATSPDGDKVIEADFDISNEGINQDAPDTAFQLPNEVGGYSVAEE